MIIQHPSGFSLLQSLIVVAAIASLMTYTMQHQRADNEQARARALGQEIATYNNAVRAFIAENTAEILAGSWPSSPNQIVFQDLKKTTCPDGNAGTASDHYLPCTFSSTTSYGNLPFGPTQVTIIDANPLHPKIKAVTSYQSLKIANQSRPDLAGLAAMTAMGNAVPNSVSQHYSAGGIASSHASIQVLGEARIEITSSNEAASDEWLRTDGSNDMQASIDFLDTNPAAQREIIGSSHIRNRPGQTLILGNGSEGVLVDSNFTVSSDSTPAMTDSGLISLTSGDQMTFRSGQEMDFGSQTDDISLTATNALLIDSKQQIQLASEHTLQITSAADMRIFAEKGDLQFQADQAIDLIADNQNMRLEAHNNAIFSAQNHLLLSTQNNAQLSAEAARDAQLSASQNIDLYAASSEFITQNTLSLDSQALTLTAHQQNLALQAGHNIDLIANDQLLLQANQDLTLDSGHGLYFKDNGSGLAIDNISISAQSADITALQGMHYQAGQDMQHQSPQGTIQLQAGQQLQARAQNLQADLTTRALMDIDAGALDLYGNQGLGLYATGDNELTANQIRIAAGAVTAGYDTALNILAEGQIMTTSDSHYRAEAEGLALSAAAMAFQQNQLFEMLAEQTLNLNAENFQFVASEGDARVSTGHNLTTAGPLFDFHATTDRMSVSGLSKTLIDATDTLAFNSGTDAQVKAGDSFAIETGVYSHEVDRSFSPKLIACSHPC